jgi:hypothetical protein
MAVNCFRYGWCKNLAEIDLMTVYEYKLRFEAFRLESVDRSYYTHSGAWLSFAAQATRQHGKKEVPVYKNFEKFFDYKKEISKAKGIKQKSRFDGIGELLREEHKDG